MINNKSNSSSSEKYDISNSEAFLSLPNDINENEIFSNENKTFISKPSLSSTQNNSNISSINNSWHPMNYIVNNFEVISSSNLQSVQKLFDKNDLLNKSEQSSPKLWGKTSKEYLHFNNIIPHGLDLYQVVAPPRLLDDEYFLESKYDLTSSELRTDLTCPICMGILQDTMVVKNCLHRFCGDCIEKCVRIGIRECPQCRNHVPSRRALRKDPIFDQIINRLFPNVKDFEDKNEYLLAEANKRLSTHSNEDLSISELDINQSRSTSPSPTSSSPLINRGVYLLVDGLSQNRNAINNLNLNNEYSQSDLKLSKAEMKRKRREIINQMKKIPFDGMFHFLLLPDPEQSDLPELKVSNKLDSPGFFSILQLSRYISSILNLNKEQLLQFYTKNHRLPFHPNSSLAYVHHQSFAFSNEIVVLYYTTRTFIDLLGSTNKGSRTLVASIQNSSLSSPSINHDFTRKKSDL